MFTIAVWIAQETWMWWVDSSNERILAQSGGHLRNDGEEICLTSFPKHNDTEQYVLTKSGYQMGTGCNTE
jgi:hypothetical protein